MSRSKIFKLNANTIISGKLWVCWGSERSYPKEINATNAPSTSKRPKSFALSM